MIINCLILRKYILSKIVLNKLLLGRWEGDFEYCDNSHITLRCTLIVTDHASRTNKALFYYKQIDGERILVRGIDELHDYEGENKFIWKKKWNPIFYREFHIAYNKELEGEQIDVGTAKYNWNCDIQNIWKKPKIKVVIRGNDVQLEGVLHKS